MVRAAAVKHRVGRQVERPHARQKKRECRRLAREPLPDRVAEATAPVANPGAKITRPCISCVMRIPLGACQMIKVPAGEFQRNIGRYQDMALTQPIAVTRNGRERTVLISVDEYQRLKRRDRQVLTPPDFTEADIAALEATRAPESSKAFDHELEQ